MIASRMRNGYEAVNLIDLCNRRKTYNVHRLVAETFLGKIPTNMQVNHINGNKFDNRLENLEIVTPSENSLHAFRTGLAKPTDNGLKKQVSVIKEGVVVGTYCSIRELCRQMKFERRSVMRALNGTKKQYKGYTFSV